MYVWRVLVPAGKYVEPVFIFGMTIILNSNGLKDDVGNPSPN